MTEKDLVGLRKEARGVAVLTLNNPPLNLNRIATIEQILLRCRQIEDDPSIRVLVVTGAGERAFSAGSDISEFAGVRSNVVAQKLARENEAFTAIEGLPVPVIAALNGVTLGGGGEIALVCDIRIMDETAQIGFPEVKLGVLPGSGGIFRLPRLVGPARAYELLYTGDIVDAAKAHRIGLVNRLVPQGQALEAALDLATALAQRPALALSLIRAGVRDAAYQDTKQATERSLAYSERVFRGPDIEEGVDAFFTKRPPVFTAPRTAEQEPGS